MIKPREPRNKTKKKVNLGRKMRRKKKRRKR